MIVHKISPSDYETSQIIVALDGKTFRSLKSRPDCRRNATVIKRELSRSLVPFARICRREQRGNVLLSFEKFQLVHLDSTGEISGYPVNRHYLFHDLLQPAFFSGSWKNEEIPS